ncbi:MAG: hypothetical protein OXG18_10240, partial [Gemmatimonadetes bacterium]|nr:hypothetical protein [Gemmatimonadota bacterium]
MRPTETDAPERRGRRPASPDHRLQPPETESRLQRYREKRLASSTGEPYGGAGAGGGGIFVVQKHRASSLHWDLRLEMHGVLVSWAVPKGPCPSQAEKRLAVHVEDPPLEYADFEGV